MYGDFRRFWWLLKKYIKSERLPIALGALTALIFTIVGLAMPFLTRFLIDTIFLGKRPELLTPLLMLSGTILVILSVTGLISDYILIKSFQKVNVQIKLDLFNKIINAPLELLLKQKSGELNYRLFNDTNSLEGFFFSIFVSVPLDILVVMIVSGFMFSWNWKLAFFVLFVLSFQVVLVSKFRTPLMRYSMSQKAKAQELSGLAVERFRNIHFIRSANSEELEVNRFYKSLDDLRQLNITTYLLGKIAGLVVNLINNLWSFGILWYGGTLVMGAQITLGTLMAFMLISGILYPRINSISNAVLSFQEVRASLRRFLEYYLIDPTISEAPEAQPLVAQQGKVVVENVTFGYNPEKLVLKDINIVFEPRSVTAIVGRSGEGKTTLCRLMLRFYDPLSGAILIDGMNIRMVTLKSLREKVGYLSQTEFVMSGTILDNVCYGLKDKPLEDVMGAIRKANLASFIEGLPLGLNTQVGEGGVQLSGGQAQRIGLARLFLRQPKIILLDEPTSFVDTESEDIIKEAILSLKQKATIIVVAHRLSTVLMADRIVVLEDGLIANIGTHEQLVKTSRIYNRLYANMLA